MSVSWGRMSPAAVRPPAPSIATMLRGSPPPGRGVAALRLAEGDLCLAYFVSGDGAETKRCQIVHLGSGDLAIVPAGGSGRYSTQAGYVAVAARGLAIVVGNGNQVVTVAESLAAGSSAVEAASAHDYEAEDRSFKPRIWAATDPAGTAVSFGAAIRSWKFAANTDRLCWSPAALRPGEGALLTTYADSAEEIVASGAPAAFRSLVNTAEEFCAEVWDALEPERRMAALAFEPLALVARGSYSKRSQ